MQKAGTTPFYMLMLVVVLSASGYVTDSNAYPFISNHPTTGKTEAKLSDTSKVLAANILSS